MITYGSIGNATAGWYVMQLLSHAKPFLILERFGQSKVMPKKQTNVMQFRRSKPIPLRLIPLQEGVTPPGNRFAYEQLAVRIQQYGDWLEFTDVVQDTNKDNVLRDMAERQGEQIGETKEKLTWDIVSNGTSVYYGGGVSQRADVAAAGLYNADLERSIVRAMQARKARKLTKVVSGSEMYETYAIEPAFIGICHTDVVPTLRDLKSASNNSKFTPVSRYGGSYRTVTRHEVGSFEETRFVATPDHGEPYKGAGASYSTEDRHITNSKIDVYPMLILGQECFATVALAGRNAVSPKIVNPNPSSGDPLGQRGTSGWKFWFACLITNEDWMTRAEFAVAK